MSDSEKAAIARWVALMRLAIHAQLAVRQAQCWRSHDE